MRRRRHMAKGRHMIAIDNAFNDSTPFFKIFYSFLKKHRLFHKLYTKRAIANVPTHKDIKKGKYTTLGDFWLTWSPYIVYDDDDFMYKEENRKSEQYKRNLQLSQLWRFYLLDNMDSIDFANDYIKDLTRSHIIYGIKTNGIRGSEEVKEYFEKYKDLLYK